MYGAGTPYALLPPEFDPLPPERLAHPLLQPWNWLWVRAVFSALFAASGLLFFSRRSNAVWPAVAVVVPFTLLVQAHWGLIGMKTSAWTGVAAAIASIACAVAAERANRLARSALGDWGTAVFASAAVGFLALGLSFALEKAWLTIALALMAAGIAVIAHYRPIPVLRWLVAGLAALVTLRLATEPSILPTGPGSLPIFNWLLYAYGVPAVSFWYAARRMLASRDDIPVKVAEAATIALTAGLLGTQIRHLMTGGDMLASLTSLGELGLHAATWLGIAIGLRVRGGPGEQRIVPRWAMFLFGGLGTVAMLLGNLLLRNPAVTGSSVGEGLIFNDLLLGYGLPAAMSGVLYYVSRGIEPAWLRRIPAAGALILAFGYVTFMVGRIFEGPVIAMSDVRDGELWAYSVAWLMFAIALLAAGFRFGSQILRQAAFGVLLIATLKVFLIDLAGLAGLQRAMSIIGLGVALIGIGLAYQRLVLKK